MNNYSEFKIYSQNYYQNYGKKCCHNVQEAACNCHPTKEEQKHVHEFEGSTKLAEEGDERHNHRFAGVSGQAVHLSGGSHFHEIFTNTDFFDHFHVIEDRTGPAIEVGGGKHVHFVSGFTTVNDDHRHAFTFATLIESPLLPAEC